MGDDFLRVSKAEMHFLNRKETAESACINIADILFVRECEAKSLPLLPKAFTHVKLHIPSYTLTGKIHYPRGRCVVDVLSSVLSFFPMSDVEISLPTGDVKSEARFLTVNMRRILSLEELKGA